MSVRININELSLVHRGSGGVSSATLPDVCKTPPGHAPVVYSNTAFSRHLAGGARTVRVDGGNPPAHASSVFAASTGDEPGALGGVASGTVGAEASWLTWSSDVKIEGKGACRLTDKMLHNHGNTVNCSGEIQAVVSTRGGDGDERLESKKRKKERESAERRRNEGKLEIAVEDEAALTAAHWYGWMDAALLRRRDKIFDLVWKDISARFVRINAYFRPPTKEFDLEAKNPYSTENWGKIDRLIAEAHKRGFVVQITLTGGAAGWTGARGIGTNLTEFATFVTERVKHYTSLGVRRFSIWNEPNHPSFFAWGKWGTKVANHKLTAGSHKEQATNLQDKKGLPADDTDRMKALAAAGLDSGATDDAIETRLKWLKESSKKNEESAKSLTKTHKKSIFEGQARGYAALYKVGYEAARAEAPQAQILLGELSSTEALKFLRLMVKYAKAPIVADGLALHPYQYKVDPRKPDPAKPDAGGMGRLFELNVLLDSLAKAGSGRQTMRTPRGKPLPIYLTEFGYHKKEGRPPVGVRVEKVRRGKRTETREVSDRQISETLRALYWKRSLEIAWKTGVRQMLVYQLVRGPDYDKSDRLTDIAKAEKSLKDAEAKAAKRTATEIDKKEVKRLAKELKKATLEGVIVWDTSVIGPKPPHAFTYPDVKDPGANSIDYALIPYKSYDAIKAWVTSSIAKNRIVLTPAEIDAALKSPGS